MWPIYEVLSKYGLDDDSELKTNLANLADSKLLAMVHDICGIAAPDTVDVSTTPEGVSLCPIGGDLGLGNLEDISRQLLLYADDIVLEEPLTSTAAVIVRIENDVTRIRGPNWRDELAKELHPYLRQLLLVRPAVERGIVRFVHNSPSLLRAKELSATITHPRLERIVVRLSDLAVCHRWPHGEQDFELGKGSNQHLGSRGMLTSGYRMYGNTMPDTVRETVVAGPWQRGPGNVTRVPGRAVLHDGRLVGSFRKAVNTIVTRTVLGVDVAQASGSWYVTDDPVEWEALSILSRIEGEQRQSEARHIADPVHLEIAKALPFVDNVSISDIVELRTKYSDEFSAFRHELIRLAREIQEVENWDGLQGRTKRMVNRDISPAISEINLLFDNLNRQRKRDVAVGVGVGSLALLAHLFAPSIQPWIGALPVAWAAGRELDRRDKADSLRERPMYFLWQLAERSKQAGTG